jgi:hypothetical protein
LDVVIQIYALTTMSYEEMQAAIDDVTGPRHRGIVMFPEGGGYEEQPKKKQKPKKNSHKRADWGL